jgi:hypothetical protein
VFARRPGLLRNKTQSAAGSQSLRSSSRRQCFAPSLMIVPEDNSLFTQLYKRYTFCITKFNHSNMHF